MAVKLHPAQGFGVITLLLYLFLFDHPECLTAEMVEMKIVDEPSSFGINSVHGTYGGYNLDTDDSALKLRIQPANFSGPAHFKRLIGRCFTSEISNYKYKFCPFDNVTQHEQGVHWNPFKGVLGVWQEWEIHNNTYVAMLMNDGNECGSLYRSAKITFKCGNHSEIVSASEPSTCNYHLEFVTPLVCHKDSMLVYPSLSSSLQQRWDRLEVEMLRGDLTQKGYNKRLRAIFETAGIKLSSSQHQQLKVKAEEAEQQKLSDGQFDSLDTCKAEFKKLQDRILELETQLKTRQDAEKDEMSEESYL